MAALAASVLSRRETFRRKQSGFRDTVAKNSCDLLDVRLLPESKEWIADYNIEMLMLDG
jgi:hypothetical protein